LSSQYSKGVRDICVKYAASLESRFLVCVNRHLEYIIDIMRA